MLGIPRGIDALAVGGAACAWLGAASPTAVGIGAAIVAALVAIARTDGRAMGALVLILVGMAASSRASGDDGVPLPAGRVTLVGVAVSDPAGAVDAAWVAVDPEFVLDGTWRSAAGLKRIVVRGPIPADLAAGEPVLVVGSGRGASFRVRAGSIGGVVDARAVERLGESPNIVFRVGNRLRSRVLGGLRSAAESPSGALLAGFLIGDVSRLPPADVEALRLAGLSHFVAVSGSNVALFLLAWWIVTAPLAWGPRARAAIGLVGLAVFVVVTRWEPSVVRAAGMAGIVLVGRLAGIPVRAWTALGVAVAGLVSLDGAIVLDIGFQLSVAATAGILLGSKVTGTGRHGWVRTTLAATVAAQAAVAPLLLHHFGSVPLLAPVTNLVAAPLVASATSIGGVGAVFHIEPLIRAGTRVAGLVLGVARGSAGLPQMTLVQVVVLAGATVLAVRFRPLRPVAALGAALVVMVSVIPAGPPAGPTAIFLDVGQGDASLLIGPAGEVVLIDGGRDPAVLREHLRRWAIERIDLLVVSHRHADHVGGLEGIGAVSRVDRMWYPRQLGEGSALDVVVGEVSAAGAVVESPAVGTIAHVGAFRVEVIGPLRRYVSPNDGSIVLRVEAGGVSVLFSGDVEAVAQADLGPLPADILKVPHQGSATSDLDWIRDSAPRIAVISVGPNDFGHPSDVVIEELRGAGASVLRTDEQGTIVLRLDHMAALPSTP